MRSYNSIEWQRVTKTTAKSLFERDGISIYCLPCKIDPCNVWYEPMKVINDFEKFTNEASYYNCGPEAGKYLAYYVRRA